MRCTIRDLMWLTFVVAILLGWVLDRFFDPHVMGIHPARSQVQETTK